jgi:hypothetical protein
MTVAIVIVVGLLGAGLAVSQLLRLKAYLAKPPPDISPDGDAD